MIPTLGLITLIIALCMSFALAISPLVTRKNTRLQHIPLWLSTLIFLCLSISFLCLMTSYIISDFSVLNVAMNSHISKPLLYKITGTWGNHEGSMLLWVLSISLFTVLFAWKSRFPFPLRSITLSTQGALLAGFLLFVLITSNPFIRIFPIPDNGMGLNPLLQDIGLAMHPPMLYLGYVGFSLGFSAAVALLFFPQENASLWAKRLKPWILTSWSFLTLGIGLGSWWAYRELGWGGFWFWDPVENASLMPWLSATALVHSLLVLEKRDTLKRWSVLLALITFSLSLLGTFLVRSGVLTSVHAFATDPARGVFILVLLFLVIGFALVLFSLRSHRLNGTATFESISRETFLLINNLLLLTACATVLLGTLYPLLLEVVSTTRISVGAPYFSAMFSVIAVPTLILAAISPLLNWRNDRLPTLLRSFYLPALCVIFSVTLLWWMELHASIPTMIMLALSSWLILGILLLIAKRIQLFRTSLSHSFSLLLNLPSNSKAMALAHIGVGLLALSITVTNQWQQETEEIMEIGHTQNIGAYTLTLQSVNYHQENNYLARRATFQVHEGNKEITRLYPETRYYPVEKTQTTEAAIYYTAMSNLYIAIGEVDDSGHVAVRSYYKPFINGIWIGCLLMVIGIILPIFRRQTLEG